MKKTKIIAMYLPQYHCIPENDEFWGKGFTDWVTVKKAKPLFEGHIQPRIPLNNNYYDLSKEEDVVWQAKLAKQYGIDGFAVYHYWFNNDKNLLTKPAELIRDSKEIEIDYFLAWDNGNWKRSWSNVHGNAWAPIAEDDKSKQKGPQILIPYILGSEPDWKNHYNYLRDHFKSDKYIKVNNKPVFLILQYSKNIQKMSEYWNKLAIEDGFDGVRVIYRNLKQLNIPESEYIYNYEPHTAGWSTLNFWQRAIGYVKRKFRFPKKNHYFDFDIIWNRILSNARKNKRENIYYGAYSAFDDSPRRGTKGADVVLGSTPEKFYRYLKEIIKISEGQDKEFLFLTAWNEWGEGAYLEPDEVEKYSYLEAVKAARQ